MDAATIKGVVDRLTRRRLTTAEPDGRRLVVTLTAEGDELVRRLTPYAGAVTAETLSPLTSREQQALTARLTRLRQ